jgi:hypothetical protein
MDTKSPSPEAFVSNPEALASLANLIKFQNQVDTVVSGGNSAMLTTTESPQPGTLAYEPWLSSWNGYVVHWKACKVDPQLLPGLDWREVYALQVEMDPSPLNSSSDGSMLMTVLAKDIPMLWRTGPQIRQPVVISGLGLVPIADNAVSPRSSSDKQPSMILASKVAWQLTHSPQ